jgi:predicted nucleic acid-binding protein
MGYLLDTCLLSEIWKPAPHQGVVDWLGRASEDELHLSVLSLGEIKRGIEKLAEGKKKARLGRDYLLLRSRFAARVLPVTAAVAEQWGELSAKASRAGRHVHVVDGLLAATALVSGLTVVTRNVEDFAVTQVAIVDPWS